MSVPLAIFGAAVPLNLGLATVNIYTQVGLITLVGLVSKHGILMVSFANEQRAHGLSRRAAIEGPHGIRFQHRIARNPSFVVGIYPLG